MWYYPGMPQPKIVEKHTHNGNDSPLISTADWVKIVAAMPDWVGRQGEMVFMDDGSTYSIFIWLNGGWREFPYTP